MQKDCIWVNVEQRPLLVRDTDRLGFTQLSAVKPKGTGVVKGKLSEYSYFLPAGEKASNSSHRGKVKLVVLQRRSGNQKAPN